MTIQDVVKKNRESLSSVDCFVTDEIYNNSPDNYGLPQHVRHLIDLPINTELTYVDVLMFLKNHLQTKHPKYVEIGVSVLKTFYQVANFLQDSELYAFDINTINPTITTLPDRLTQNFTKSFIINQSSFSLVIRCLSSSESSV